ncbi:hypothetical protein GSI_01684 [Ganoderma sinense ZZ0214-1]|uniref:SUN domain-containing protein n=1 Tax=Ganoderma sinense ZZ0214-1 TaxID=1077348 RepID=A0A2G8SQI2_9APHY|nr:hypothetical protein GSI_01684 [Ganoderma sinense ZZ0214-1]
MDAILISARHLLSIPTRLFCPPKRPRDPQLPTISDSLLARALPLGRHDYALSANGGKLFLPLTSPEGSIVSSNPIDSILSDDFRINGAWRSPHSHAQVGLSFPLTIYPTHFTIDYAFNPDPVAMKSAPRQLIFWGVVEGAGNKARYARTLANLEVSDVVNRTAPLLHRGEIFMPLGSAQYDVHDGPHIQTFPLHPGGVESGIDFGVVVLEVISNWGGNETWLYRVRVHGSASVKH